MWNRKNNDRICQSKRLVFRQCTWQSLNTPSTIQLTKIKHGGRYY